MQTKIITQLSEVTPEELTAQILKGVKDQFDNFKAELSRDISPKKPDELLTRHDLSELFSVTTVTIDNWAKKGIIKSYRIGNLVRFKKHEAVEALTKIRS